MSLFSLPEWAAFGFLHRTSEAPGSHLQRSAPGKQQRPERRGNSAPSGGAVRGVGDYGRRVPSTIACSDLISQAGAVMIESDGVQMPAHYGSPGGELAVCVARIGLAARTDLAALSITANGPAFDELAEYLPRCSLAPGGLASDGDICWCRDAEDHALMLVSPRRIASRLVRILRHTLVQWGVTLTDSPDQRVVLGVIGRRATSLLADLGLCGPDQDLRSIAPCTRIDLGGASILVLLLNERDVLIVMERQDATAAWQAILRAGRPYGISLVGLEAVRRYRLTARTAAGRFDLPEPD